MPRPSSVEALPSDILEKLQALLRDPRVTQMEATRRINAILEEQNHPDRLSKSAVNRYAVKMDKVGEKLKQSREIAEMWIARLGNQPQGKTGQLINELIRTMTFDVAMQAAEGEFASPDLLKDLALTMQRLEKAASLNEEREKKIREEARAEAAQAAESTARKAGVSEDTIKAIRRDVLGMS